MFKCCSCKAKKKKEAFSEPPIVHSCVKKTKFNLSQVQVLYKKFQTISQDKKYLDKLNFREMMGFIDNPNSMLIVDRIFLSIKENKSPGIKFEGFVIYLDTLMNGDNSKKTELCYYLIDTRKKDYFFQMDLTNLVLSILQANGSFSSQFEHDYRAAKISTYLFQKFDQNREGKVTKKQFKRIVAEDPNLLEIFTLLNKGISDAIISQTIEEDRKIVYLKQIKYITGSLRDIRREIEYPVKMSKISSIDERVLDAKKVKFGVHGDEEEKEVLVKTGRNGTRSVGKGGKAHTNSNFFVNKKVLNQIGGLASGGMNGSRSVEEKGKRFFKEGMKTQNPYLGKKPSMVSGNQANPFARKSRGGVYQGSSPKLHHRGPRLSSKKSNMSISDIPDEGPGIRRLPSEINIPVIRLGDINIATAFSEIGKKMNTLTSYNDGDEAIEEVSDSFRYSKMGSQISKDINMNLNRNFSRQMTPEKANIYNSRLEGRNFQPNNELLRMKVVDLLRYSETLLENLEAENRAIENQVKNLNVKNNFIKRLTRNIPKNNTQASEKKKDLLVFIFHKDWNLVINMMIGINKSIRALWYVNNHKLTKSDYKMRDIFELNYRRSFSDSEGLKGTCIFYNYAPYVFSDIRAHFNISNDNYLSSIGSEALITSLMKGEISTFSSLTSSGKSGSFIYYSMDGRFILKTVRKDEYRLLKSILMDYHKHIKTNKETLIPKFFGLHKIIFTNKNVAKQIGSDTVYFCIMGNIFGASCEIDEMFDLKGSTYKRSLNKKQLEDLASKKAKYAQKDLDFINKKKRIFVTKEERKNLIEVLKKDVEFFKRNSIIDYSLLVGFHNGGNYPSNGGDPQQYSIDDSKLLKKIESVNGSEIYFIGVVDILTTFSHFKKKAEYLFKRCFLGKGISCVPADQYGDRFLNFMEKVIVEGERDNLAIENLGIRKNNTNPTTGKPWDRTREHNRFKI